MEFLEIFIEVLKDELSNKEFWISTIIMMVVGMIIMFAIGVLLLPWILPLFN